MKKFFTISLYLFVYTPIFYVNGMSMKFLKRGMSMHTYNTHHIGQALRTNLPKTYNASNYYFSQKQSRIGMEIITYAKEAFDIKFATMNKNNTLDEYKEKVYQKKEYDVYDVLIQQEIQVDQESFDMISNSLLADNFLWKGIGGFDGGKRITSKVVNKDTQEVFYVDTQGYSYARYVGIE